jgi:hypothetical protein
VHKIPVVRQCLASCPADALDLVICSPGGDINAAYVIVRQLRRRFGKDLTCYVPWYAKSAATLICLPMDELVMGDLGELGPLDLQHQEKQRGDFPQIRSCLERFKGLEQLQRHSIETFEVMVQNILEGSGMKPADACGIAAEFTGKVCGAMYQQIDPDSLGQNARFMEIGYEYAERLLRRYRPGIYETEKGRQIVEYLVRHYPSHDFIIDLEELADLGLPARLMDQQESKIFENFQSAVSELEEPDFIELVLADEAKGTDRSADVDAHQTAQSVQDGLAQIRKVK